MGRGAKPHAGGGGVWGTDALRTQGDVGGGGFCSGDARLREKPLWRVSVSTSKNSLEGSFTSGETIDWQVRVILKAGDEIKKVQDQIVNRLQV